MALNQRQKMFAEQYLKTLNATEAARRAGYKAKNASQMGYENLRKPEIKAYIHARMQEMEFVANVDETLAFLTKVMRGEVKDQFGLDASLADRLKAGESLLKRFDAVESRQENSGPREIVVMLEKETESAE